MVFTVAVAVALAGCEALTVRGSAPTGEWTSRRTLDEAAGCVVRAFDSVNTRITHAIQIKVPGRVYEIVPQQTLTVGAEIYYARLEAEKGNTFMQLFSIGVFTRDMMPALASCAN